jgi:Protein of unknown function (DUF3099)
MARDPEPVRITTASRSHSDDVWAREKRYMWTMGIRTACFIGAAVCFMAGLPLWLVWTLMGGSLVLPYIAVVMANAGVSPDPGGPDPFDERPSTAIEQGPQTPTESRDSSNGSRDK